MNGWHSADNTLNHSREEIKIKTVGPKAHSVMLAIVSNNRQQIFKADAMLVFGDKAGARNAVPIDS